jgi:citrate lyase subunit alpha/citrate CoA-transferase
MVEKKIRGSFGMGGITGLMVDLLESGCFECLMDAQCFDIRAVNSLRDNPRHSEISVSHYASPTAKSSLVDSLDVVVLGATQIDTDFNVHTDSNGYIIGGSGGHSDTAEGAKMSVIVSPLTRSRFSTVVDKVLYLSTPGSAIDVLVTQKGVAVNPARSDLKDRLTDAGLPVVDIHDLKRMAEEITGVPEPVALGDKVVAKVLYRDGSVIDNIRNVL